MKLPKRIIDSNGFTVFIPPAPFTEDWSENCSKIEEGSCLFDYVKKYCNNSEEHLYWHDCIGFAGPMSGWSGFIIVKDNKIIKMSKSLTC